MNKGIENFGVVKEALERKKMAKTGKLQVRKCRIKKSRY